MHREKLIMKGIEKTCSLAQPQKITWLLLLHPTVPAFSLPYTEFLSWLRAQKLLWAWPALLTQHVASLGNDSRWNEPILFWLAETLIYRMSWHSSRHHVCLILKIIPSDSVVHSCDQVSNFHILQGSKARKTSLNCFFFHLNTVKKH